MPLRLRTSSVRRGGSIHRYHQLTRAIRRDGKPTHEVVAHLGRLPDDEAEAIRVALAALGGRRPGPQNVKSYAGLSLDDIVAHKAPLFLGVAVLHRLWKQWGLDVFFREHLPRGAALVEPEALAEVMVLNRCLDPCSKLRVTEWFPRTALSSLLGISSKHINNSRLHRVLNQLDGVDDKLSRYLCKHPLRRKNGDTVIYLDFTDTWFAGRGGTYAKNGKVKDGSFRHSRIQIALCVDSQGLPLRWELVPGNVQENAELPKWVDAFDEIKEFRGLPLVFDRGFSSYESVIKLLKSNRLFVTCARRPQIAAWSSQIDFAAIAKTPPTERPACSVVKKAGLGQATDDDDLFFVDQKVRQPVSCGKKWPELRVVLVFRPSQYAFETHRIMKDKERLDKNIKKINEDLARAAADRDKTSTMARVRVALGKAHFIYDYKPVLKDIKVKNKKGKIVSSFQITLEALDYKNESRDWNPGWRVLYAHPDDKRSARELIRLYDRKVAVELAFRTIKSFIELRPIRHHTDAKIKMHVTLCVIALLLDRWVEVLLRNAGIRDSVDRVYEALEPCRLLTIGAKGQTATRLLTTDLDSRQRKILAALNMADLAEPAVAASIFPNPML